MEHNHKLKPKTRKGKEKMKNLEIFETLVNIEMVKVQEMWAGTEELKKYSFGWLEKDQEGGGAIGSLHSDTFHFIENIITIAKATEVNIFLDIKKNIDGTPTPVIVAF